MPVAAQNRKRVIGFLLSRRIVRVECAYGNNVHNILLLLYHTLSYVPNTYRRCAENLAVATLSSGTRRKPLSLTAIARCGGNEPTPCRISANFNPFASHFIRIRRKDLLKSDLTRTPARDKCFFSVIADDTGETRRAHHILSYTYCCTPPPSRYYL